MKLGQNTAVIETSGGFFLNRIKMELVSNDFLQKIWFMHMTIKTCVFNKLMSKTVKFTLIYFTEFLPQQQPREWIKIIRKHSCYKRY